MTDKPLSTALTKRTTGKFSLIAAVACLACFAGPIVAILAPAGLGTWFGIPSLAITAIGGVILPALLMRRHQVKRQPSIDEAVVVKTAPERALR